MSNGWRLDALDGRAGLAFGSYRGPLDTEPSTDLPAVFVAPPDFEAQYLVSRATALAATNRTSQEGLFIKDEEVTFASLDHLISFIRRCYVSGAGGNGADGGGSQVPGLPPEGPPNSESDNPERPEGDQYLENQIDPIDLLSEALNKYNQEANQLSSVPGAETPAMPSSIVKKFMWLESEQLTSSAAAYAVQRGAQIILAELLGRYDGGPTDAEFLSWMRAAESFSRACERLGLWETWMRRFYSGFWRMVSSKMMQSFARPRGFASLHDIYQHYRRHFPVESEAEFAVALTHHLLNHNQYDYDFLVRYGYYPGSYFFIAQFNHPRMAPGNFFGDASRWPIPKYLWKVVDNSEATNPSTADLLAVITAAPLKILALEGKQRCEALEICLFAAAHLNSLDSASPDVVDSNWPPDPVRGEVHLGAQSRRGAVWLASQMPPYALPIVLEDMIGVMPSRRYATTRS